MCLWIFFCSRPLNSIIALDSNRKFRFFFLVANTLNINSNSKFRVYVFDGFFFRSSFVVCTCCRKTTRIYKHRIRIISSLLLRFEFQASSTLNSQTYVFHFILFFAPSLCYSTSIYLIRECSANCLTAIHTWNIQCVCVWMRQRLTGTHLTFILWAHKQQ